MEGETKLTVGDILQIMDQKIEYVEGVYGDIDKEEYIWFLGSAIHDVMFNIRQMLDIMNQEPNDQLKKILDIKSRVDSKNKYRISLFKEV